MPIKTETQDRAISLFTYLRELCALRITHARDVNSYDEVLWFSDVPKEKGCSCVAWSLDQSTAPASEEGSNLWLEIHKPKLKSPPEVPDELDRWIKDADLNDSGKEEPGLYEEIIITLPPDPETGEELTKVLTLAEAPEILDIWADYVENHWQPWAKEDRRLKAVQRVYDCLFTIYQRAEKLGEQYEVVVGLGYLLWRSPHSGELRHPTLLLQARLEFDRIRGIMTVAAGQEGPQPSLEIDMLEPDDKPGVTDVMAIQSMLTELSSAPWDTAVLDAVLKSLANALSATSHYERTLEKPQQISADPQMNIAPCLILRKRTRRTFVDFYQKIIDQIEDGAKIPEAVRSLVEVVEHSAPVEEDGFEYEPHENVLPKDTELYFPLSANDEQKEIVRRIERGRGLLVQGPPGTGKSHTIANLICHFLAKGLRVLVTSETPRALKVLHDKLPDEIQELCVVWLGAGPDAQASLERSVKGITHKKISWVKQTSAKMNRDLAEKLDQARKDQARIRQQLTSCREADTYRHENVFGIYSGTLQEIACNIRAQTDRYGWVIDRPNEKEEPLVSGEELLRLIGVHRQLTDELFRDITAQHLAVDNLMSPAEFKTLVDKEKQAVVLCSQTKGQTTYLGYESLKGVTSEERLKMVHLLKKVMNSLDNLSKHVHEWADRAAREIAGDQDRVWRELLATTQEHIKSHDGNIRALSSLEVVGWDGRDHAEVARHAQMLKTHLEAGKSLGFGPFRSASVKQSIYLVKHVRVDGAPCDNPDLLQKLIDWLDLEKRMGQLAAYWRNYTEPPVGDFTTQIAVYQDLCEPLQEAIDMHDLFVELKLCMAKIPELASPRWHVRSDLYDVTAALVSAEAQSDLTIAKNAFDPIEAMITTFLEADDAHTATKTLLDAVQARDVHEYGRAYATIIDMNKWRQEYNAVCDIFERFRKALPKTAEKYAESVMSDDSWKNRFEEFHSAWIWAKTDQWLSVMNDGGRVQELKNALDNAQRDELVLLSRLSANRAWQYCMTELGEGKRQALMAWMQAVERIRRGTGRHAERHRETARERLAECRQAIPAWIMPLYQVVQTISAGTDLFDVVIVDEASQSGPEALLLNYIAKKIIVVGDDKQIRPMHVGINRDHVVNLSQMHLENIPFKETLDLDGSLFAQAELRFPGRIRLREHFRCMPEIIQFCNGLSYANEPLIPLRQYGSDRLTPVQTKHVVDGYREGRSPHIINRPEAKSIVDKIVECIEDPAYDQKTFGVICLLGSAQATLIGTLLVAELGPETMEAKQLICGTPYDFQGDERNIIFLSMVDAPQEGRACTMVRDSETQRRYNVAVSRARDQVWLFHTPTSNDLRPECLRYKLLEYCNNPVVEQNKVGGLDVGQLQRLAMSRERDMGRTPEPFDSWFEIDVFLVIVARGYRVLPQLEFASYRIDLVVEGIQGRMAVECDGDHWHGPDRFYDDMRRQRDLERCGWTFWRVKGSDFYRDPNVALGSLWEKLEQLDILPQQAWQEQKAKRAAPDKSSVYTNETVIDESDVNTTNEASLADSVDVCEQTDSEENGGEGRLDHAIDFAKKIRKKRSLEDLPAIEIQNAIIQVLSNCPKNSCTMKSISTRVLSQMGILTRGAPRADFDTRVKRNIGVLKRNGRVEEYRAKNVRIRLITVRSEQTTMFEDSRDGTH